MISILVPCISRQKELDECLPTWLGQNGVPYEIIIACGPGILPKSNNVRTIPANPKGICSTYNDLYAAAKGDKFLILHCDIKFKNTDTLAVMADGELDMWCITTAKFKRDDGTIEQGRWAQIFMVDRGFAIANPWNADMDNGYAWEEAYVLSSMVESGGWFRIIEWPIGFMPEHIAHERPAQDVANRAKYARNQRIYLKRFPVPIMQLFDGKIRVEEVKL